MIHEDHRARLRQRYLQEGLDGFHPHEALELLLFYAIPRRNTNELAHALLARFGSLNAVLDAHPQELTQVDGMGESAAVLLSLMPKLWRMYRRESSRGQKALSTYSLAGEFAVDLFIGRQREAVMLLTLDSSCRLIRDHVMGEGTVSEVTLHPRTVMETVLRDNASQIILVHNHPGGMMQPSPADLEYTRKIIMALSTIDVAVADHMIVSDQEFFSMAHHGLLSRLQKEVEVRLLSDVASYQSVKQAPAVYQIT